MVPYMYSCTHILLHMRVQCFNERLTKPHSSTAPDHPSVFSFGEVIKQGRDPDHKAHRKLLQWRNMLQPPQKIFNCKYTKQKFVPFSDMVLNLHFSGTTHIHTYACTGTSHTCWYLKQKWLWVHKAGRKLLAGTTEIHGREFFQKVDEAGKTFSRLGQSAWQSIATECGGCAEWKDLRGRWTTTPGKLQITRMPSKGHAREVLLRISKR